MERKKQKVVVLGASAKPDRYSNKAVYRLKEKGYEVIPVHPRFKEIYDLPVISSLSEINEEIDTVSLYIGPKGVKPLIPEIIKLKPKRVILNPGTEDPELEEALVKNGIRPVAACTLVLLATEQFDGA
jgi:uncharacterized protein